MYDTDFLKILPNIIHHENAIRSNKLKLINKIITLSKEEHIDRKSKEYFHMVFSLIDELYLYLRSPIISSNFLEILAKGLISNHLNDNYTVQFTGVLASSTAIQEIASFIRFIDIFNHYNIKTFSHLLFVHWEDEIPDHESKGYEDFYVKELMIKKMLKKISNVHLLPLHSSYKNHPESFVSLLNQKFFSYAFNFHQNLLQNTVKDSFLVKDKEWIVSFYQRQESLKKFNIEKILFDLAIRSAIGKIETDIITSGLHNQGAAIFLMLTSELNKRFLNCYNSPVPILNIKLNIDY